MAENSARQAKPAAFSPAERREIEAFWRAYEPIYDEVARATREELYRHPAFGPILKRIAPDRLDQDDRTGYERLKAAIEHGEWSPYLDFLAAQGSQYARAGIGFPAWFEAVGSFRARFLPQLVERYRDEPDALAAAVAGMDRYVDLVMATIGEAYLSTKERIIRQQQEAIAELSTPVLKVREGLLILPLVGVIDTHRAQLLTHNLLLSIRDNRARMVVMDITGVPTVDSRVANHLVQTVDAARLMGATVFVSGISPEIAQTLVALGINLEGMVTSGDLQSAVERAEQRLGYRVTREEPEQ